MKPEAFVMALGGIGWLLSGYQLMATSPKFAILVCVPLACVLFYFGRRA